MKRLKWLRIVITILFLASCSPTTDTVNFPVEDNPNPLNPITPEQNNPDMATTLESEDFQEGLEQPSPIKEKNQVEPIATEELSTMTPNNLDVPNPDELPQVSIAKEDLATRLSISKDSIEVIKVELVTWPNGAMGCPQPGMVYAQVMQDGLLIQLSVDNVIYNYHSGGARDPFLCQPSPPVKSTPFNLDLEEFITPPSDNINE